MLDKVIRNHVEKQDDLENQIENDIDLLLTTINMGEVLRDPTEVMMAVVDKLRAILKDKYIPEAIENGVEFAKIVEKMENKGQDIMIFKSEDPKLNEELLDADNRKD